MALGLSERPQGRAAPSPAFPSDRRTGQARAPQRGQATVEMLVLAAVLVPMLLLFPVVGRCLDIMQAGEQASRYVAFEAVAHPVGTAGARSETDLATEVGRRILSRAGTQVLSLEGVERTPVERLPLWRDTLGQALLDPARTATRIEVRDFDAVPALVPLGGMLAHTELGLPRRREAVASVQLSTLPLAGLAPFDALTLDVHRTTALLTDAWDAGNTGTARTRVQGMHWLYPTEPIQPLMAGLGTLPLLVADERFSADGFNADGWAVLPCDRIRPAC